MATKIVGLDAFLRETKESVTQYWITEQNNRLIEYARRTTQEIGRQINSYANANHMDDTGNLLDSLVWLLTYDCKLVQGGFYRHKSATRNSYLHERSFVTYVDKNPRKGSRGAGTKSYTAEDLLNRNYQWTTANAGEPVDGHALAWAFASKQRTKGIPHGWQLTFAVLAPYWGYWEEGFKMKGRHGYSFARFAIMTQFYDTISNDLKPARTKFRTRAAKYASKSLLSSAKRADRNAKKAAKKL